MKKHLIFGFATLSFLLTAFSSLHAQTDTTVVVKDKKALSKLSFQMKKFNNAVTSYVRTLKKANPKDTTITNEVAAYSDSVNKDLENKNSHDSNTLHKLQAHFDSLVQSSVRLIKKVESDTSLKNNKTLIQMGKTMNSMREKIIQYQQSLNESVKKNSAKKEENQGEPEPAKP
ncbi:MAG: hypothetical protein IT244_03120 [Bacteroidia bacterium]|nr:hypothetical protein [Bacteroidia bacterium]